MSGGLSEPSPSLPAPRLSQLSQATIYGLYSSGRGAVATALSSLLPDPHPNSEPAANHALWDT